MTTYHQPDLFSVTPQDDIWLEMASLKNEVKNIRRGLFGRYDKLLLEKSELKERVLFLEKQLGIQKEEDKIFSVNFS